MDTQIYGVWTQTVAELMSYRYLGCRSELGDGFEAHGHMPIRSDMRHGDGLLAAPVAIAMLDTAGIAVDRHWQLALTHVDTQLCGPVEGLAAIDVHGSMTRVESFDVRIVKAGKKGPFAATASVRSEVAGSVLISARMRQDGDETNLVATALVRLTRQHDHRTEGTS